MIGALLDQVRPRAGFADALLESDETLTAVVSEQETTSRTASRHIHLRVEVEGRSGLATADGLVFEPMVEAALQHARYGPPSALLAPAPAPLPAVVTCYPACAALAPADLLGMARMLRDRLQAEGREVEAWAERSVGRVDVGNTRGVIAGYDVSLAGLGVRVRAKTPSGPAQLRLHDAGSGAPDDAMLAALVDEVEWRLAPPLLEESPPDGESIWFGPRAVAALVVPLCQALIAGRVWSEEGPFAGMVGERILSPLVTLTDDPLAPGRPGTSPVDDEGVVCRPITLIREGVLCGALADLATATRLGIPASGHGRRSPGGPPWTGWSNLRVESGSAGPNGRLLLNEGILVRDLPLPAAECYDGRIALATPWAYQVRGGEVVGRYERLVLKGNVFEWLNRVERVGEGGWIGGRFLPNLVIARV